MKISTIDFEDGKGARFKIVAENRTENALLDACVTPEYLKEYSPYLIRNVKTDNAFILVLPVYNDGESQ